LGFNLLAPIQFLGEITMEEKGIPKKTEVEEA